MFGCIVFSATGAGFAHWHARKIKIFRNKFMKNLFLSIFLFMSLSLSAQPKGQQAIFDASSTSFIDYGKGVSLNGYDQLSNGSQITITLWVKWTGKTMVGVGEWANLFTLADTASSGDNGVFWMQHNQTNSKFEFALNTQTSGRQWVQSVTNPQEGVWYHIACVYDASLANNNLKLYINGVKESSRDQKGNVTIFGSKTKLNVGRWPNPSNSYRRFNGLIDEISVWSRALSLTEVVDIMNRPESLTGSSYDAARLVGYYNFDNGTTNDLSTSGNNGVNGGGVIFTNSGSLPVELVNFDVVNQQGKIMLNWATATETNNNFFTIERSIDGVNAEVIGVVKGAGNSNSLLNYNFVDDNPLSGIAYYRIKQTDFDGTFESFDWKSISLSLKSESKFTVYPNPTAGNISIILTNATAGTSELTVVDLLGKVVYSQTMQHDEMLSNSFDLPSDLKSGIYFVQINNQNTRFVEKIILQ